MATNVLGRWGDPYSDVGPLSVYLASCDLDYMTGQSLIIDGGYYLCPKGAGNVHHEETFTRLGARI